MLSATTVNSIGGARSGGRTEDPTAASPDAPPPASDAVPNAPRRSERPSLFLFDHCAAGRRINFIRSITSRDAGTAEKPLGLPMRSNADRPASRCKIVRGRHWHNPGRSDRYWRRQPARDQERGAASVSATSFVVTLVVPLFQEGHEMDRGKLTARNPQLQCGPNSGNAALRTLDRAEGGAREEWPAPRSETSPEIVHASFQLLE